MKYFISAWFGWAHFRSNDGICLINFDVREGLLYVSHCWINNWNFHLILIWDCCTFDMLMVNVYKIHWAFVFDESSTTYTPERNSTPTRYTNKVNRKKRIRKHNEIPYIECRGIRARIRIKVNQINLIVLEILSRKSHLYFIDNNWNGQNVRQNSNVAWNFVHEKHIDFGIWKFQKLAHSTRIILCQCTHRFGMK